MSRFLTGVVLLVWLAMLTGCGGNKVPAKGRIALDNAEQFELLSLDPVHQYDPPKEYFHGWRVLGRTPITDTELRRKLVAALHQGAGEIGGPLPGCFNPRHGIRTVHDGKTVDFVICFECYQVQFYDGDQQSPFVVSRSPQPVFDQALRDANVPLAKKANEQNGVELNIP